ncbi:hypothetical protein NPIL_638101 [Nephila pilipes]|uniref:Uncharacterized protein n=1 Tax=Nephila pilipes TaxID=299642 RepID=A0A8X6P416_NEPPI|nr:hypothetical protein NPIL_638101 [Nephila pilipes]
MYRGKLSRQVVKSSLVLSQYFMTWNRDSNKDSPFLVDFDVHSCRGLQVLLMMEFGKELKYTYGVPAHAAFRWLRATPYVLRRCSLPHGGLACRQPARYEQVPQPKRCTWYGRCKCAVTRKCVLKRAGGWYARIAGVCLFASVAGNSGTLPGRGGRAIASWQSKCAFTASVSPASAPQAGAQLWPALFTGS